MGRVHGELLLAAGERIVALGDESAECTAEARDVLGLGADTPLFTDAKDLAAAVERGELRVDAAFVASHTRWHARDAEPLVKAGK